MLQLGKGTFGVVYKDGDIAVKKFKELGSSGRDQHEIVVQEVILLGYLRESPYVARMKDFNLDKMEIRLHLYDMSLSDALNKYKFQYEDCKKVFRDILKGVSHMHSLDLVHCDLKHSNILVNINPLSAVITDPGLASLSKYGRFIQTPIGYRRPDSMLVDAHKHKEKHDYYSLSIIGTEMFGDIWFKSTVTPERLIQVIKNLSIPDEIKIPLIELSKLESKIYPSIRSILIGVFKEDSVMAMPVIAPPSDNRIPEVNEKYLYNTIKKLCTDSKILKGNRAYNMLKERFNNPKYTHVSLAEYPLYITCSVLIISAIFGRPGFGYESIKIATNNMYSTGSINRVMTDLISKNELMEIIMIAE